MYKVSKLSNGAGFFNFFIRMELQFDIASLKITSLGNHTAQETVLSILVTVMELGH
jgi:hypothetical protein